jgi:hypothetical protein
MIRGYARPSYFLADGGVVQGCTGSYVRIGDVTTRTDADASIFNMVPALNGASGALTLQHEQSGLPLIAHIANTCYGWTQLLAANTSDAQDKATFYRVPGLNGQPGTWSFRLYATTDPVPAGGDYRNRDTNTYLSLTKWVEIRLATAPAAGSSQSAIAAFNDNASFYVDEQ